MPYQKGYGYIHKRKNPPILTIQRGVEIGKPADAFTYINAGSPQSYEIAIGILSKWLRTKDTIREVTSGMYSGSYASHWYEEKITEAMMYHVRGYCKYKTGNLAGAEGDYLTGLACADNPQMGQIYGYMRLGQIYAAQGNHREAMRYYNLWQEASNSELGARLMGTRNPAWSMFNIDRGFYLRAVSERALGDIENARANCQKAIALRDGNYPKASALLAELGSASAHSPSMLIAGPTVVEFTPGGGSTVTSTQMQVGGTIDFTRPSAEASSASAAPPPTPPATQQQAVARATVNSFLAATQSLSSSAPGDYTEAQLQVLALQEHLSETPEAVETLANRNSKGKGKSMMEQLYTSYSGGLSALISAREIARTCATTFSDLYPSAGIAHLRQIGVQLDDMVGNQRTPTGDYFADRMP